MKKKLALFLGLVPFLAAAQNPIIQTKYTADPAPMVHNDTLFLYVGCDEKDAPHNAYLMREYRLYTTTDMVNWTDCGAPLRTSDFKWSAGDASAAQCIERDGKFYWYISSQNKFSPGSSIGVAVAESPYGPFKDALGKALVTNNMTTAAKHSWDDLDPTVFIDSNKQAYLYWGNGVCYQAKLNKDMISLNGPITALDIKDKTAFFGKFTEAPWVYKRNNLYYMIYAAEFPESIHYSTGQTAEGPWKAEGVVMPLEKGSNTNHPGIIDYKGNSYFFYHTGKLPGGGGFGRSAAVEQFKYNADGTFPIINATREGVSPVGTLNPYERVEAETIAFSEGVKSEPNVKTGIYISEIHNGDYIKVREVDFGKKSPKWFTATVASALRGGTLEVRTDSISGPLIAELTIPSTGGWECWKTLQTDIVKPVTGIKDIYFVFKGRKGCKLFNFDWYRFSK